MKEKEETKNRNSIKYIEKSKKGITLVALVVTIVVLLILAGVTITALLGDDGIIKKAQNAADLMNNAIQNEQNEMNALLNELDEIIIGNGGGGTTGGGDDEQTTGPNGKPLLNTVNQIQYDNNIEAEDSYGNIVWVPKGFKVVEGSSGEEITVPNGVVIEDVAGNQFVWIPVGTVYKDNTGTNTSTIKLGRYTFDTSNGTPTMQQAAFAGDNTAEGKENQTYDNEIVTISSYYQELTEPRDGVNGYEDGENATAKDLAGFMQSVSEHGGYYIARYEASYGSGSSTSDWKPLSKESTATRTSSSTSLTPGMLWNYITQLDAAQVSRNMYAGNKDIEGNSVGVESDLINSYAWDTAIVYIQEMGHDNYANYGRDETGNTSLMDTGKTGDVVCNIYDMAGNAVEWTTEYSTGTNSIGADPCVRRGGNYSGSICAAYRSSINSNNSFSFVSFRLSLYVK